jgi:hypothetical protein
MYADDLLNRLVAASQERQITKKDLAAQAKLHVNTLRKFGEVIDGRPQWNPQVATVRALERVLLGDR